MSKYNAFQIVKDFEQAVCDYTGARFCVAVNSCTNALFLALKWRMIENPLHSFEPTWVTIPKYTYVSVPMQIKLAGYLVEFGDYTWSGSYELLPLRILDSARRFTSGMYAPGTIICTSHHWSKILSLSQAGCILHDNVFADKWFRKARFDGRTEGVAPKDDKFDMLGYHMYLSPEIAAQGLVKLMHLPEHNIDLPNDDYPDLSKMEIFK